MDRRFIEAPRFPVDRVNEVSAKEKGGGGRPPIWEMVFWWTRKPLIGARTVVAASLLPESADLTAFLRIVRLLGVEGSPHRHNPVMVPEYRELFTKAKLLDPFAGFGSIPLEAARLGIDKVVAVELLPTAYVFLKAILEIPKWAADNRLGDQLVKDLEKWGGWVVDQLKEDPDIRELYDDDIAVYIGSWEIRCPHCSRYTPLVGNWWLARVSRETTEEEELEEETKKGIYSKIAWMTPKNTEDRIYIDVVDLNRELNKNSVEAKINSRQGVVEAYGRRYTVPRPNIDARRETAACLHCNNTITNKGKKEEWYVKQALKEWNQNLEKYLSGEITIQQLIESKARPRLLARVKTIGKDLTFEPATQQDSDRLWRALEKLKQIWGDPDIPTEPMTPYGGPTLGDPPLIFGKFFKLFNPRQLLTLVKLVKLIREAGRRVEEEKLEQGWDKQKAHKYAEAITTYLAIALCKHADYNSIVNRYRPDKVRFEGTFAQRGIAIIWNYVDANPYVKTAGMTGHLINTLESVIEGLLYLINAVSGSPSRVEVVLDDATVLSKLGDERFDLIVTDPPYRDDVPYAELSDFYYVWLKRVLCDVRDVYGVLVRVPRFYSEAFFDDSGGEVEVQWRRFASREVSESEGRASFFGEGVGSFDYFKRLLSESFKVMADRLNDSGVAVTYYAHTTPDAWEALLEAGWLNAGLRVTATHSFVTESAQRVTARGKISLDTSLVVVWRKGVSREALVDEVYARAVEDCSEFAEKAMKFGRSGVDLFVSVLGCILSQFTQYRSLVGVGDLRKKGLGDLVKSYIYPATAEAIARSLGVKAAEKRLSPYSMFYLLAKVLIERRPRASRRSMDRNTAVIFSIGTRAELSALEALGLIQRDGDRITLLEPLHVEDPRRAVEATLIDRGLTPSAPSIRSSIDALHILEYLAISMPKDMFVKHYSELRSRSPQHVEEAIALAKILYSVLPENDSERKAVDTLLNSLGEAPQRGLLIYSKKG
ncbi:MAG: DUF1156 domain-containing protein [Ignisphaera sp.]